jgi:hypothetical protein
MWWSRPSAIGEYVFLADVPEVLVHAGAVELLKNNIAIVIKEAVAVSRSYAITFRRFVGLVRPRSKAGPRRNSVQP